LKDFRWPENRGNIAAIETSRKSSFRMFILSLFILVSPSGMVETPRFEGMREYFESILRKDLRRIVPLKGIQSKNTSIYKKKVLAQHCK
jgi:hypothetical protein